MGESKLLASSEGKKLSKNVFIILLICGILLLIIGAFLAILEVFEAAALNADIVVFYIIEGILFATLGLLILIFAAPFRKRSNTSLEIYEDYVMAKWLLAKQAVRIEYSQIEDVKVKTGGRRIDLQLGPPFNKSVFSTIVIFRLDNKDAQHLHDILLEKRSHVQG